MPYGVIYCLTNLANGKFYIGQTSQAPTLRLYQHFKDAERKTGPLQAALRKYGRDGFSFEVLSEADSADDLNRLETLWILSTNANIRGIGYNCDSGGTSKTANAETREKLRVAHLGKKQGPEQIAKRVMSMKGKKRSGVALQNLVNGARKRSAQLTPEQRSAMADRFRLFATGREPPNKGKKGIQTPWNKGIPMSEEMKSRQSALRKGVSLSPEHKARISAAMKGKMPTVNLRRKAATAA